MRRSGAAGRSSRLANQARAAASSLTGVCTSAHLGFPGRDGRGPEASDPSIPQILLSPRLSLELTAPLVDLRLELRAEGMFDLDVEAGGRLHPIDGEGPIALRGRIACQGNPYVAETFAVANPVVKLLRLFQQRHARFDLSAA